MMYDESYGAIMKEFADLKPKRCHYKKDNDTEKNAEGTNKMCD